MEFLLLLSTDKELQFNFESDLIYAGGTNAQNF